MSAASMPFESETAGYPCVDVEPTMLRRSASAFVMSLLVTIVLASSFRGIANSALTQAIDGYFDRRATKLLKPVPALVAQYRNDEIADVNAGD